MSYSIRLTDSELETLGWAASRGYWPADAFDALAFGESEPEEAADGQERLWLLPKHAAWSITEMAADDPHAYLTCIGEPLLGKLLMLESQIV